MKKETIEKIEDEITKKTTMPDNLKSKVRKEIFTNILLAIGIVVYFIFIILGSLDTTKAVRSIDLKIFSLILLFTSIILFEIAYKKDSGKLAINGIEVLIIAIITLFLPYIVFELDSKHQKYYILSGSIIAIYYIIKSIIITNRAKTLYEKKESDIKEITKKEIKREDFLDEEVEEVSNKNEKENRISKRKEKSKKVNNKNVRADRDTNPKETAAPKKRGRPRKDASKEVKKEESEPKKAKKKKENKVETDSKNNKQENKAPKRRGRPRKVVNN
ncbi:MAG: hypothetical protein J5507_06530 [Clostridia bacterium]|nr:hypothetical protein [Clostridia bacterium]